MDDWYQILGVAETATGEEIKAAYRKKVLELHPDRNPLKGAAGTEAFNKVGDAYRILSNTELRKNYDRKKNAGSIFNTDRFNIPTPTQVVSQVANILDEDLFDTLNKFLGKGPDPKNIEIKVSLSLEELYNGVDKEIAYTRFEACDSCKGRGAVNREDFKICQACFGSGTSPSLASLFRKQECKPCKGMGKLILNKCATCNGLGVSKKEINLIIPIPNDLAPTDRLIVPKEGQADGDLIIQLETEPHPYFEIINNIDLSIDLPINYYQAVLGDFLEIDTLKGPAHFKLEEGTQMEDVHVLKGYGLKRADKVGDLHIKFSITIPKKPTKAQKELLEQYRELDQKKTKKQKPKKRVAEEESD